MGRQLRIEYPGAHYHVTARGNERKDVFKSIRDREKFLSYLESAVLRYGAVIHAYCLMNNHYHLLLETPSGNLSQVMQHINGAYTNYFNAKRKRSGHLLQGRYKAILIEADDYALELSRYIHLNPVRAGASGNPVDYQWSSYRDYIGLRSSPKWLNTDFILGYFGTSKVTTPKKYRKFVEDGIGKEQESPLKRAVAATILGSDDFVADVQERHVDMKAADRNLPALRQLINRPPIDRIIETTTEAFGDNERMAGKAAIYICHRCSGAKLREIGERFGVKDSAVSQASRRFEMELVKDRELRKTIEKLAKTLGLSNV
jgi:REP element-mobilizing transposase RayT